MEPNADLGGNNISADLRGSGSRPLDKNLFVFCFAEYKNQPRDPMVQALVLQARGEIHHQRETYQLLVNILLCCFLVSINQG